MIRYIYSIMVAMTKKAKILWVDLEMTGLNAKEDLILEAAAIATDWDFKEIAVYEGIVKSDEAHIRKRMRENSLFWDKNPESRKGLLDQNSNGKDTSSVEDDLLRLIEDHFDDDIPVLLGGNSIHMDRRFIAEKWPRLDQRLHYRMLDVSAWKVVFEGKFKKKFPKPEEHRALGDIRGSIMELEYYLKKVRPSL